MKCSFCHKPDKSVRKLIANSRWSLRRVYICDACVAACNRILNDDASAPAPAEVRTKPPRRRWFWPFQTMTRQSA